MTHLTRLKICRSCSSWSRFWRSYPCLP